MLKPLQNIDNGPNTKMLLNISKNQNQLSNDPGEEDDAFGGNQEIFQTKALGLEDIPNEIGTTIDQRKFTNGIN